MKSFAKNIRHKIQSAGSDHIRIVRGLGLVMFFIAIGKTVGAAKEVAIAYKFGMSELVDIYILALTFAMWIPACAFSVITSIYIPLIHKLDDSNKESFRNQFTSMILVLSGLVTVVLMFLLPMILDLLSAQYSAANSEAAKKLAIGFAPLAGMGILAAHMSTMLLSDERHANTLFEIIPSLCLVILVLSWPVSNTIDPLLWGTVVGTLLHATGLFLLLKRSHTKIIPDFTLSSHGWKDFRSNIGIILAAQIVMSFVEPVGTAIAASLGTGNVAGIGYSTRILALFLTLGATAVARAILPVLSNTTRSETDRVRLATQWAALTFIIGTITALVTWMLAPQIVRILLERGAFSADDTVAVTQGVRFGVLQFPFFFPGLVLVQLFISQGNYKIVFLSACMALVTKLIFSLLLAPVYSFAGIILASTPMYAANTCLFLWVLRNRKLKLKI